MTQDSRRSRSPMLTAEAVQRAADDVPAHQIDPPRTVLLCGEALLGAQDRDQLLLLSSNVAWTTARRLCQNEHTDMCFGDVVALAGAVIDVLLTGKDVPEEWLP